MDSRRHRRLSRSWLILVACGLGACGNSDDGADTGDVLAQPSGSSVTITGTVTYDFVPSEALGGLVFEDTEPRPARFVSVQYVDGASVLASTRTDANGSYSLTVPGNRTGFIRARAESTGNASLGWSFRVRDNINGDAVYAIDGAPRSSGTADSTRDLHAASGWTGTEYGSERAAAPFAILDTIVTGAEFLVDIGVTGFPALSIHWSPENVASYNEDGDPDPVTGEIGSSFFGTNIGLGINGIYILGDELGDTDEYDRHVIVHEFGHYLEYAFGRSDSIGGPHSRGDLLDPRVAFSEGWATAFAAIVLDDPVYRDAGGFQQGGAFAFNVEGRRPLEGDNPFPGWYSEESVWELFYDLVDTEIDGADLLAYPFADVWAIMVGRIVTTPALTTIFPFLNALKQTMPGDAPQLDVLSADQSITPVAGDFGEGETNDAGSADVLPIYTELEVNGPAVNVCSTDAFTSATTGSTNKLSSRRFIRFTPPAAGNVAIEVRATAVPAGAFADPDWLVYRFEPIYVSDGPPSETCKAFDAAGWAPGDCAEPDPATGPALVPVINAEYVLEVYEWTNTNDAIEDPDYPPIGRTCFDVTVTQ